MDVCLCVCDGTTRGPAAVRLHDHAFQIHPHPTTTVEFATVGTPMQCIQIKMAHDAYSATPKFRGFLDAAAGIVREEGAYVGGWFVGGWVCGRWGLHGSIEWGWGVLESDVIVLYHIIHMINHQPGFWRGLYAGVGPTVLKGGVNNCIRFSAFNEMKHLYQAYKGKWSKVRFFSCLSNSHAIIYYTHVNMCALSVY